VSDPYRDERADALRRRYHAAFQDPELPVPVDAIAEDLLGLKVGEDESMTVSGMLVPARREVWLNARESRDSPGRRRFTLAHELGHWVCQCREGKAAGAAPVYCRAEEIGAGPEAKALEREANVFAAELLMPEREVRTTWTGDVPATADRFGVSAEAMQWRLYSFGLTDAPASRGSRPGSA
jgi:Zn-dependent peptidase ImmA (M78 family)